MHEAVLGGPYSGLKIAYVEEDDENVDNSKHKEFDHKDITKGNPIKDSELAHDSSEKGEKVQYEKEDRCVNITKNEGKLRLDGKNSDWSVLAKVLDRIFFIIFILATIIVLGIFLGIGFLHLTNEQDCL